MLAMYKAVQSFHLNEFLDGNTYLNKNSCIHFRQTSDVILLLELSFGSLGGIKAVDESLELSFSS